MTRRAVFLDRDGVLVRAAPHGEFAHGPLTLEDFSMFPNIAEPVERLRAAGFVTVLVTNQPAIARGQMSWETLNEMHRRLQASVHLDEIEVCPHTDADNCLCRKPKPGMLLDAAKKLSIDLGASYFIGDTRRDYGAASAAGVKFILIGWPYNQSLQVEHRVMDLDEAVRVILKTVRHQ